MALNLASPSTCRMTLALNAQAAMRTFAFRVFRTGTGGGALGRVMCQSPSGGTITFDDFYWNSTAWGWQSRRNSASSPTSLSSIGSTATSTWYNFVLVRNQTTSSLAVFVNGTKFTFTIAGTGSYNSSTDPYYIGNRGDNTRNFAGSIADIGIWDRLLDDAEAVSYCSGLAAPHFQGAVALVDCAGDRTIDLRAAPPTVSGATLSAHPRVYL